MNQNLLGIAIAMPHATAQEIRMDRIQLGVDIGSPC